VEFSWGQPCVEPHCLWLEVASCLVAESFCTFLSSDYFRSRGMVQPCYFIRLQFYKSFAASGNNATCKKILWLFFKGCWVLMHSGDSLHICQVPHIFPLSLLWTAEFISSELAFLVAFGAGRGCLEIFVSRKHLKKPPLSCLGWKRCQALVISFTCGCLFTWEFFTPALFYLILSTSLIKLFKSWVHLYQIQRITLGGRILYFRLHQLLCCTYHDLLPT
jgi:hypothetical protein